MKQSSKWLVRSLIILGIGIPVVVELTTLMGLIGNSFSDQGATNSNTSEENVRRIRPGNELLPETPPSEVLKTAYVLAGSGSWEFNMTITLSKLKGLQSLSVTLDSLTTRNGVKIYEPVTYQRNALDADSAYTLDARWDIPAGEQPKSIHMNATYIGYGDSLSRKLNKQLLFSKIPVRGSR